MSEKNDYKGFNDSSSWAPALVLGLFLLYILGKYFFVLLLAFTY